MKRLTHFLLTAIVLLGLGWTLWHGFMHRLPDADDEKGAEKAPAEEPEEFAVTLTKEQCEALGVEVAELKAVSSAPQVSAYGRVLDPQPLVTFDGDLLTAESALVASQAERERTQKLLASGENASRKTVETAEAQYRADETKVQSLRRAAELQWGTKIASLAAAPRRALMDALISGEAAFVRLDVLPADRFEGAPGAAHLLIPGHEDQPLTTGDVAAATGVDEKTQTQGFLVLVERPPFPMRAGMALTAWLELPGKAEAGFAVPRAAVLRQDAQTWVYVQEEDEFHRRLVALRHALEGEDGWFVAAEGAALKAGDRLVIKGAESILSAELKSGGGAD